MEVIHLECAVVDPGSGLDGRKWNRQHFYCFWIVFDRLVAVVYRFDLTLKIFFSSSYTISTPAHFNLRPHSSSFYLKMLVLPNTEHFSATTPGNEH
jgi:hypothetical protein